MKKLPRKNVVTDVGIYITLQLISGRFFDAGLFGHKIGYSDQRWFRQSRRCFKVENFEWVKYAVIVGGLLFGLMGSVLGYGRALYKFNEIHGVEVLDKRDIRTLRDLQAEKGASSLPFYALLAFYELVCIGGALIMGSVLLGAVLLLTNRTG